MVKLFEPLTIRGLTLKNRIVMSPMCQYSTGPDGCPTDWHFVHLGSRATAGVGLCVVEATSVESRGRLSLGDTGMYSDQQIAPFQRIVDFVHSQSAAIGIQLAHAGRKAWSDKKGHGPERPVSAGPLPYNEGWEAPAELTTEDIDQVIASWREAARRSREAGFDVIEIHAAHGYLVHQFLSPLSNDRQDEYGGSLSNRMRFACRVVEAIREEWPAEKPLFMRVSATDWADGGWDIEQSICLARDMKAHGVDLIDCSSGGLTPLQQVKQGPGYQVPFAEAVRREALISTGAVGLITEPEHANSILERDCADLVFLGRALLRDPYWALHAATTLGHDMEWPVQYLRAKQ